jgi:hypothetical protein
VAKKVEPRGEDYTQLPPEAFLKTLPSLVLPPYRIPSEKDLKRRRAIARRMDRFRERMGPIEGTVTDLIREDRAIR